MRTDFNQMASDKRWVQLTGVMKEVRQEMSSLAPHPTKGKQSVNDNAAAASNDRDGMLGGFLLDGILGGAFLSAVTDAFDLPAGAEDLPVGQAVEVYDEYNRDRHGTCYALGERSAISHGFNAGATHRRAPRSAEADFWDRYLTDLPSRRALEQNMAGLNLKMGRIEQEFSAQTLKPARLSLGM